MAKQLGVIQYAGKLGQTVGMKNGYGGSNSFSREYVGTNKSDSDAQILRRMRLLPANNFRRQLDSLIKRGFQGVKYGGPSLREFNRYALRLTLAETPQLVKDSTVAFPGPYLISKGSLGNITCTIGEDTVTTNVPLTQTTVSQLTIGEFSTALVGGGLVRNGDMVTFIAAYISSAEQDNPQNVTYMVESIQVDTESSEDIPLTIAGDVVTLDYSSSNYIQFTWNDGIIVAGMAIVLSREGTTPLRSTSRMGVTTSYWPTIFGSTLKEAVRQSYKKTTAATMATNWPYDPDAEIETDTMIDGTYTIAGLTGGNAAFNGAVVRVKRWETSGDLAAVYCKNPADPVYGGTAPFCVGTNDAVIVRTISMEEEGLSVSYVTEFNGLPRVIIPGD